MKKLLVLVLTLVLALALPVVAVGEEDAAWYSLEGEVLTVTLPLSAIEGLSSNAQSEPAPSYDVEAVDSPQGIFELVTSETKDDSWIASYRVIADCEDVVTLTFTTTCDGDIWSRYALDIAIGESGMEVVEEIKPWFGIYDGNLRLRLPANPSTGYEWKYELSDEAVLKLVNEEYVQDAAEEDMVGVGGTWTAEFDGAASSTGEAVLALRYCRDWEDQAPAREYAFRLSVDENGGVTIASVETVPPEADEAAIESATTTETPSEPAE